MVHPQGSAATDSLRKSKIAACKHFLFVTQRISMNLKMSWNGSFNIESLATAFVMCPPCTVAALFYC